MTPGEITAAVKAELDDERLETFAPFAIERAKSAIVSRLFPYDHDAVWKDVPERYHPNCVSIAVYLVNRRGAEGETSHAEAGVSRTWESADIPESMFGSIVSKVGVIS